MHNYHLNNKIVCLYDFVLKHAVMPFWSK